MRNGKFDLKTHALRYEEIIRKHKEDQRRHQALGLVTEESKYDKVDVYKSRLHADVRRQDKQNKEAKIRAFSEKQHKMERARNYSKNVKDMYMPRSGSSKVLG